jgi:hypothetical protein
MTVAGPITSACATWLSASKANTQDAARCVLNIPRSIRRASSAEVIDIVR